MLKIDINSKNNSENTDFHQACDNCHSEIAEMIIKNLSDLKIDFNSKNNGGIVAFHQAHDNGHSEISRNDYEENIRSEN